MFNSEFRFSFGSLASQFDADRCRNRLLKLQGRNETKCDPII